MTEIISPAASIVLHSVILVALIVNSAITEDSKLQRFLLVLTLAPLIRIVSFSMPLHEISDIAHWYAVVAVPLFLGTYFIARILQMSAFDVGLTGRCLRIQALIAASGLALGFVEYLILRPVPLIAEFSVSAFVIPAASLLVATGLLEELIFRGLMLRTLAESLGYWSIPYTSL